MNFVRSLVFFFAATLVAVTAQAASVDRNLPYISYVNFQSLDPDEPLTVSGQLRMPQISTEVSVPAVVIVHGSAGVDSRGKFYAEALNDAGFATLEIDMWAARGWTGKVDNRPNTVAETLPDAYGALRYLAELDNIDADRIGIMGFSWGGVVAMLTATDPYTDQYSADLSGLKFAAHVAHYPICWIYNSVEGYDFDSFTGAPVLIQAGGRDDYDDSLGMCSALVDYLDEDFISVNTYRKATHAWDRLQPAMTVTDITSHRGQGGEVKFIPSPGMAVQARSKAILFFKKYLK